jgi:hypothetical protein
MTTSEMRSTYDRVYEAMYYAGRDALKSCSDAELSLLIGLAEDEENGWIQDVATDELEHRSS